MASDSGAGMELARAQLLADLAAEAVVDPLDDQDLAWLAAVLRRDQGWVRAALRLGPA